MITITGAGANDGTYLLESVSDLELELADVDQPTLGGTFSPVTIAQEELVEQATYTMTGSPLVTFRDNGAEPDTITRSTGNWLLERFDAETAIHVTGAGDNDGTYMVESVTATVITLSADDSLITTDPLSGVQISQTVMRAAEQPADSADGLGAGPVAGGGAHIHWAKHGSAVVGQLAE